MSVRTEFSDEVIRAREREDQERHKRLAALVMQSEQCKYITRGSKGDLLAYRWYFCYLREGHPGPHKDPYHRDFRSDLHIRDIRKGQMPCEFVKKVDPPRKDEPSYLKCYLIEDHLGPHRDRWGGSFHSNTIDIDIFIYLGRWPVRTEPFPPVQVGKL